MDSATRSGPDPLQRAQGRSKAGRRAERVPLETDASPSSGNALRRSNSLGCPVRPNAPKSGGRPGPDSCVKWCETWCGAGSVVGSLGPRRPKGRPRPTPVGTRRTRQTSKCASVEMHFKTPRPRRRREARGHIFGAGGARHTMGRAPRGILRLFGTVVNPWKLCNLDPWCGSNVRATESHPLLAAPA